MSEGARVWLVPAGMNPRRGARGHRRATRQSACLTRRLSRRGFSVPFYFEDRDPLKEVVVIVPPGRTLHIRANEMDGVEIPRGVPYAVRVEARVPVTVRCSGMDTTQAALSLMTAMAYPVER